MNQTKNDLAQQGIVLLKILDLSSQARLQGKSKPVKTAFADIRNEIGISNKTSTTS
jgi:hypothetical protein